MSCSAFIRPSWYGLSILAVMASALTVSQAMEIPNAPPLGLPPFVVPSDNPLNAIKVTLGRKLFKDKRFSADGTISCETCHDRQLAFSDGRPVAQGIKKQSGTRNAPTIVNTAYSSFQFWDGRRSSLEGQAEDPFVNPVEHGLENHDSILQVIREDAKYRALFKKAFNISPAGIALEHVTKAIACFERTLLSGDSPFDRYQYGKESAALSPSAIAGLELFQGRADCVSCHRIDAQNALFTDNQFHRLGIGHQRIDKRLGDLAARYVNSPGRNIGKTLLERPESSELGRFLVTLNPNDIGRFKTPSLRNIAATAPYMHDGSIETLEAAVEMELYYRGSEAGRPLILTPKEKKNLVDFLRALTSPEFAQAAAGHVTKRNR